MWTRCSAGMAIDQHKQCLYMRACQVEMAVFGFSAEPLLDMNSAWQRRRMHSNSSEQSSNSCRQCWCSIVWHGSVALKSLWVLAFYRCLFKTATSSSTIQCVCSSTVAVLHLPYMHGFSSDLWQVAFARWTKRYKQSSANRMLKTSRFFVGKLVYVEAILTLSYCVHAVCACCLRKSGRFVSLTIAWRHMACARNLLDRSGHLLRAVFEHVFQTPQ